MSGEYKSPCGCVLHVIQWTSRRKVITQTSCPLHKHAKELLDMCWELRTQAMELQSIVNIPPKLYDRLCSVISKAEGRG